MNMVYLLTYLVLIFLDSVWEFYFKVLDERLLKILLEGVDMTH